ncbi:hypothetical protein M0638_20885 [Roseomonas sp. NAR14]|uniref:Uncharacterized protein n=1 Tax=Roseomonas acroporae TaxID=2937791 RepID=A0A9X1YBS0_9PROT|nr:hypothetical protein [Roseomonas acroporae]MCK8786832.1 hypothetical protein [Roseomonas acroporae]
MAGQVGQSLKIALGEDKVAYVVRYKPSHTKAPPDEGHSDCLLQTGAPVGYFGTGAVGDGVVFTYSRFLSNRPQYVNYDDAKSKSCVSTILVSSCGKTAAKAFRDAWIAMRAKTDGFTIVGNNCSTHASRACRAAGLIRADGIDGLDTPDNLYKQIVKDSVFPWESLSGYLVIVPDATRSSTSDEMMKDFGAYMELTTSPVSGGAGKAGGSSSY